MLFSDLPNIISGSVLQHQADLEIIQLAIDSRNIFHGRKNTLFFAINGQNHNGHEHIVDLYQQGIRQFVIAEHLNIAVLPEANFILVKDTVEALQSIAIFHRKRFSYPVIGITGSNGKTTTKEWLYHLVSPFRNTVKNPKSYNSQIGVPLSVWHMNKFHELGIFEAGISTTNEMDNLQKIIQPKIGIITNIGSAHDEGFTNQIEKLAEKLKLFKNSEQLIYCKDHKEIHQQVVTNNIPATSWSLVTNSDVDISIRLNKALVGQTSISISYQSTSFDCILPFVHDASLENALHCISTMLYLDFTPDEILIGLEKLPVVKMRLELKPGVNGCQVIDDTYNNDLAGLEVAINFLSQQSSLKRTVILSDILQSGLSNKELYNNVVNLFISNQVTRIIAVGENISAQKSSFPETSVFYKTTEALMADLDNLNFNNEVILVKGARPFLFEQITSKLAQKIHGTTLEIDLNALTHNLNYYRQLLSQKTQLMAMVKAMAYGSGSNEIAHLLAHHKVDYLGVAYTDEGVILRKSGIKTPIMVMNVSPDGFDNIITYNLEPEIYSLDLLKQFIQFLNETSLRIHLKIDTGMRRLGFHEGDITELLTLLKEYSNIHVKSIFSHLAGSDEAIHNDYSHQQINVLNKVYNQVCDALEISPMKHVLNSSGILRFPEYHFDMVRLGIGLYGIDSNLTDQDHLLPISSLKTTVSQINQIKLGETIGYGRKGKADKDLTIATIAIGYADGFSRAFSNGVGKVIVNGQEAAVIGNVCMDMTIIDVTSIDIAVGDEILIFGDKMPITILAQKLNTIPYEILTNVSERVKRVYFQD